jgi:beta-glucosidase
MFNRTYRYFSEEPLYPFGYGLSYSTFTYSRATVTPGQMDANTSVAVNVLVSNSSTLAGDEVAQLYVSHPGLDGAPLRALAGFQRVHLAAHASQTVSFTLSPRELSIVDANGARQVPAGPIELWIGGGQSLSAVTGASSDGCSLKLTITTSATLPE